MTVFITGDRANDQLNPGFVAVEMLRALGRGEDIMTGDNAGVEALVRQLGVMAEFPVLVVESPKTDEGYTDWDRRHAELSDDVRVLFVHGSPMQSRIGRSLLSVLPDERVALINPVAEIILGQAVEQEDDEPSF